MNEVIQLDSKYTKKNLLEMNRILQKKMARLCALLSLVGLVMIAAGIYFAQGSLIYFGVFWFLFFLVRIHHGARKITRKTIKQYKTRYGAEEVTTTLKFYQNMVTAANHQSGAELRAEYGDIARVIRTKNLYVLVLPDHTAIMGERRSLDRETDQALWERLLDRCRTASFEARDFKSNPEKNAE